MEPKRFIWKDAHYLNTPRMCGYNSFPNYSPKEVEQMVRKNLAQHITRDLCGGAFYVAYGPNNTYTYKETVDWDSRVYMTDETDQDKMYFASFDAGYHKLPWHIVISRKLPVFIVPWDHAIFSGVAAHVGICIFSEFPVPEYKTIRMNVLERGLSIARAIPALPSFIGSGQLDYLMNRSNRDTKYVRQAVDIEETKRRSKQAGVAFASQALSDYLPWLFRNLPDTVTHLNVVVTCLLEDDRDQFNTFSGIFVRNSRQDTVEQINESLRNNMGIAWMMNDMYKAIDMFKQHGVGDTVSISRMKQILTPLRFTPDVIFTSLFSVPGSNAVVHNTYSSAPFYACLVDSAITTSSNSAVYDVTKFK
jgi:hypothetical protein